MPLSPHRQVAASRLQPSPVLDLERTTDMDYCPDPLLPDGCSSPTQACTENRCLQQPSLSRVPLRRSMVPVPHTVRSDSGTTVQVTGDLAAVMNLQCGSAEYQLAHYDADGAYYQRHRDALPDGGETPDQRRVRFGNDTARPLSP